VIVSFNPHTQQRSYVSPSCRRLYGYEPEEAIALHASEVIHPNDYTGVQEALSRLAEHGDQTPVTYRGRRKDGTYVWVEASLTHSTNPETGAMEIDSVVRNVSERVRYEAVLRQSKDQTDAANRAKSAFLGTVSHELRTPLNAIIGFADMIQQEILGPIGNDRYRSYIVDIHTSGTHLLDVINEILDFSKIEAGMLELHEDIFDLTECIRRGAPDRPTDQGRGVFRRNRRTGNVSPPSGRRTQGSPSPVQPAQQRGEIHATRRTHQHIRPIRPADWRQHHGCGYRDRDRARTSRPGIRAFHTS
jgi:PAS domain S-box-containing protein